MGILTIFDFMTAAIAGGVCGFFMARAFYKRPIAKRRVKNLTIPSVINQAPKVQKVKHKPKSQSEEILFKKEMEQNNKNPRMF